MKTNLDSQFTSPRYLVNEPVPLNRISQNDFILAKELLDTAYLIMEPDRQTQRKAFAKIMPIIYMLRESKKFTFKQINSFLRKCSFKLTDSSVRSYYCRLKNINEAEYIKQMRLQISIFAEIKKEALNIESTNHPLTNKNEEG